MVALHPIRRELPYPIVATRVVAILRSTASTHLVSVATALRDAGIRCIEVTLTTPGALESIAEIRDVLGDSADIGAGSVLTVAELEAAIHMGASYTLSPCLDLRIVERAQELGTPHIPGAATPTEVFAAWEAGVPAVKIFPAAQLGGPGFLRALRDPMPALKLIPTGGVQHAHAADYLEAGAVALGVGSPLVQDALVRGPDDGLRARVHEFLVAVRPWQQGTDD
jgi:2-dehydro-3-deoxyphosphogluconate aldolase/(4S)-4-hydroxy-2-oxoglutarate aldolase